jgi:thiamine biosynthesis lipoprotein
MKLNVLQRCKPLLGTFIEISLQGDHSQQALIDYSEEAFTELKRLHNKLSFHEADSDLTRLNLKLLQQFPDKIHLTEELSDLLALGQSMYHLSGGYFDLTIAPNLIFSEQLPNHLGISPKEYGNFSNVTIENNSLRSNKPLCIDLGGIAKGYAVDKAMAKIPTDCIASINAGGDLYHNHWQGESVDIKYGEKTSAKKRVMMRDAALATSGNYLQGNQSAFINPITNQQHKFKGSISVFAPSVMIADALTKVVLLTPKHSIKSILKCFDAQAIKINRFGFSKNI